MFKLAYEALSAMGTAPCILNAANEIAVDKFLKGKIKFSHIPKFINKALEKIENHRDPDVQTIVDCDKETREFVGGLVT
jgi:1-deoxy-D-xylulose-5-phosphate reductoisomerase